jgi:hypothetical protein
MDFVEIVKAYYAALDSDDMEQAGQYLSDQYQLVDFFPQIMDKESLFDMLKLFKAAMPNLRHSLSNMRVEERVVKLTVQLSGTSTHNLDLRKFGIGVVPSSQKFIIFPNANFELHINNNRIFLERDVSPVSPNRRMPGMLKAMGVNIATL